MDSSSNGIVTSSSNDVRSKTTVMTAGCWELVTAGPNGSAGEGIEVTAEVSMEKGATVAASSSGNSSTHPSEEQEEEKAIGLHSSKASSAISTSDASPPLVSHFQRPDLYAAWRYCIPLYLISTIVLLLAADIGSGIQAILVTIPSSVDRWSTRTENIVADESIFTSVRHLWHTQSYPLAIFLVITSIAWPYIKLLVTLYAWMVPPPTSNTTSNANGLVKRERLLEIFDVLGKWSFADVFVFCKILVAFRATIPAGGGTIMEVYMLARWGFYGFVLATILSLIGTHVILYHHRKYIYQNQHNKNYETSGTRRRITTDDKQDAENKRQSTSNNRLHNNSHNTAVIGPLEKAILIFILFTGLAAYLYGCTADLFQVSRQRGSIETLYDDYSIISVGTTYVESTKYANAGDQWIQCLWFLLALVMPILSAILMAVLLVVPNHQHIWQRRIFTMAEIAFAWNGGEVIVLSTLFAVLQIPSFGDGIMDSGCDVCYVIGSELYLGTLMPLLIGSFVHIGSAFWMYRRWHPMLFVASSNDSSSSDSSSDSSSSANNNDTEDADDGGKEGDTNAASKQYSDA